MASRMAFYQTSVRTALGVADAFERMAHVERFAEWDPGVLRGTQVRGVGPGPDAVYDLLIDALPKQTFRYQITQYEAPNRYRMVARTALFTSYDDVVVEAWGGGARVTYAAELVLNGPLAVFDRALRPVFRRIGDRAARGLAQFLSGALEP
jgi:hypothetical protein